MPRRLCIFNGLKFWQVPHTRLLDFTFLEILKFRFFGLVPFATAKSLRRKWREKGHPILVGIHLKVSKQTKEFEWLWRVCVLVLFERWISCRMDFMPRARKKPRQGIGVFICLALRPKAPFEIHWLSVSGGERVFWDLFTDTCRN